MKRPELFLMSLSILLPVLVTGMRYRRMLPAYIPIITLLGLGLLNEIIIYFFFYFNSAIVNNIYCLLECMIWCWQFRKWKNILKNTTGFYTLILSLGALWIFENLILLHIETYSPLFRIAYSLTLVLLAVNQLNWLIINVRSTIYRNPVFIVCISLIIFFSYKILMEIFYYYAREQAVQHHIFSLEVYVNILFNVLLAIAILCIPRKKDFILQLL